MAQEKKSVTAMIETLERLEDNKGDWGKYKIKLEGFENVFAVAVPPDINREYVLEEGYEVCLTEGKYTDWVLTTRSPFITGEVNSSVNNAVKDPLKKTSPYTAKEESAGKGGKNGAVSEKKQPKYDSDKYTNFNTYQIVKRDPQMRLQTLLQLSADCHMFCFKNKLDPEDFMTMVVKDAKRFNATLLEYLSDDSHI